MARRVFSQTVFTPANARADTVTFVAGDALGFFKGASGTQQTYFWEISISGMASASSSPTPMLFSRDSTVGTGAQTVGVDAVVAPATAALAAPITTGSTFATTFPQRDAANHLQNCGLNAFGGVYFWRGNRLEECMTMVGNTASFGECSLSAHNIGATLGAISGHVIYETL